MHFYDLVVPPEAKGQRLDVFLTRYAEALPSTHALASFSRARWQTLISEQLVHVADKVARPAVKLRPGDKIAVQVPPPAPSCVVPVAMPLEILFEDEHLVIVNKPAGLVVHPGAGTTAPTLVHGLLAHCQDLSGIGGVLRPGIVHRLDRGTSGVIVAAKHDRAHESLARAFARRQITKRYVAFVYGRPIAERAVIETFYARHPTQRRRFTSRVTSGRQALTEYRVSAHACGISRLDVVLGTGRTHQIRVHLSDAGYPLVGDPLYGPRRNLGRLPEPVRALITPITRQALHAASLRFAHPITGSTIEAAAPLAADLQELADGLSLRSR